MTDYNNTSTRSTSTRRKAIRAERLDPAYLVAAPPIAAANTARTPAINLSGKTISVLADKLLNNQLVRYNNILLPKRRRPNRLSCLSSVQRYNCIASCIRNYLYYRAVNGIGRAYSIYYYRLDNIYSNIDDYTPTPI